MRPDKETCRTCVAFYWSDDAQRIYAAAVRVGDIPAPHGSDGECRLTPSPVKRGADDWCMSHQTPNEWQAKWRMR